MAYYKHIQEVYDTKRGSRRTGRVESGSRYKARLEARGRDDLVAAD